MNYRLEVTRISVSDVDWAKAFYQGLEWRLDADADQDGYRQEVTTRGPGRTTSPLAVYGSERNLEAALRRAGAAYGRHEADTGQKDENWPAWYAHYMAQDPQA
jgi:catechol 2,3-dioxygenase-like lactoylglutathione lyase family enzyme